MPEWDVTKPAGADIVADFPTDSPANILKPLKDALSRQHTFPGVYDSTSGRHTSFELSDATDEVEFLLRQLAKTAPTSAYKFIIDGANRDHLHLLGYLTDSTYLGLMLLHQFTKNVQLAGELSGKMNQVVSPGTRLFFVQAACPTGWTQITSYNDKMLRVVDNTGGDLGNGIGGDWDFDSILDIMDLSKDGAHDHTFTSWPIPASSTTDLGSSWISPGPAAVWAVLSTHAHTASGISSEEPTHGHSFVSDGGWRPLYVDCILGNKDT